MKCALALLAAFLLFAPAAVADYLNPPPWTDPGYVTYQGWEFETNLLPTTVNNPFGAPTMTSDYGSEMRIPSFEGRDGVMYFDGWNDDWIYIDVPNADNMNPRKEIWMQIVYFAWDGFPGLDYYIDGWGNETTGFAGQGIEPTVLQSTANGAWVYEAVHWYIEPNPEGETITLASSFYEDMYIDQIHIDTICFPEPASLSLLLLGGLAVLRRR